MQLNPIGIIHSPYKERKDAPRQGRLSDNQIILEVFPQFADALLQLDKLSHIIVLYWGSQADRQILQSHTPFSKDMLVGVFASRSPNRPNPIAFCIADLLSIDGNKLTVRGVDALDGSPLLDIKAYASAIDAVPNSRSWHAPDAITAEPDGK